MMYLRATGTQLAEAFLITPTTNATLKLNVQKALSALQLLSREVLAIELPWTDETNRRASPPDASTAFSSRYVSNSWLRAFCIC